jgi:hypothetical protein
VQDNTLVADNEYDAFSVIAPNDPALPGGGGYQVSGLYDVTPTKFGQILNNVTDSQTIGEAAGLQARRYVQPRRPRRTRRNQLRTPRSS